MVFHLFITASLLRYPEVPYVKTMKEAFNPILVIHCCSYAAFWFEVNSAIPAGALSNVLLIVLPQQGCCITGTISICVLKVVEYGPQVLSWVIKSIFLADGYGWIVKFRDRK